MNAQNATHAAKNLGSGESQAAKWQAGLPEGERILFQVALDINQNRQFDKILLVLTGRRLLEIRNGTKKPGSGSCIPPSPFDPLSFPD
jgi:hypothetical protein